MRKIIINKKGDVPIVILVLGVFLICMMVLGSFYFFQNRMKRVFVGVGVIERAAAVEDKYYFYKNLEIFTDEEIEQMLGIQRDEEGNKYVLIEKKTIHGFLGVFGEEKRVVSVKYFLPQP